MLPQMMPLPWVSVFLLLFFCFFVFWCWASSFYYTKTISVSKSVKSVFVSLPW